MVEGARLESVYTVTPYRGFESLRVRHFAEFGMYSTMNFYQNDLFWNISSTIIALIAICMAMILPFLIESRDANNFRLLIIDEMSENYEKISKMQKAEDATLPDGLKISPIQLHDAIGKHIDISVWKDYRYKLANLKKKDYEQLKNINRHAEAIIGLQNDITMDDRLRFVARIEEAKEFSSKYEALFKD